METIQLDELFKQEYSLVVPNAVIDKINKLINESYITEISGDYSIYLNNKFDIPIIISYECASDFHLGYREHSIYIMGPSGYINELQVNNEIIVRLPYNIFVYSDYNITKMELEEAIKDI